MISGKTYWVLGMMLFTSMAVADELSVIRVGFPHDSLYELSFTGPHGIAVGDHGLLLESHDQGQTWVANENVGVDQALLSVAMSADRSLVVGQEGMILTRNGSETWKQRDGGTAERLLSVAMADSGLAIAVGAFGTILKSSDFGASWETLTVSWEEYLEDPGYEPHLYDVEITPEGYILLAGEFGQILISRDGGDTWEQRNASDESIFGMTVLSNGQGMAVGQNGYVVRTSDGGENWTQVQTPGNANLLDVWLSEDGQAVAVGIRALLISSDGGQSWTPSTSTAMSRSWYTSLAASTQLFMAGQLGMIVEIKLH